MRPSAQEISSARAPCGALTPVGRRCGCSAMTYWSLSLRSAAWSAICRSPLANPSESVQCKPLEVQVGDKGIERAIKHLKRKMAAEGILRELKRRRHYMKPSVKRRKKMSEAARRRRKRLKTEERP